MTEEQNKTPIMCDDMEPESPEPDSRPFEEQPINPPTPTGKTTASKEEPAPAQKETQKPDEEDEDHPFQDFKESVRNHIGESLYVLGMKKNRYAYAGMEKELEKSSTRTLKREMGIALIGTVLIMTFLAVVIGFIARSPDYLKDPTLDMGFFACIGTTLTTKSFFVYALICTVFAGGLLYAIYRKTGTLDPRRIELSENDTYGSDRFMSEREIRDSLRVEPIEINDGPMYGKLKTGEVVARHLEYRPGKKNYNSSTVVFGASGGRKTRGYLVNNVYQSIRRGENCFINDPKMEIYALTSEQFRKAGYHVHLFATKPDFMSVSDSWNPLDSINGDFVKASMVANRIIFRNSEQNRTEFWITAATSLLTGLIQYVTSNEEYVKNKINTIPEIGRLITHEVQNLYTLPETLPPDHPAMDQLLIFYNSGDIVKQSVVYNLGLILGLFGGKVKKLVGHSDFNLTDAAGEEKHVFFLGTDDQDDTFYFLNSILINFAYSDLVAKIDTMPGRKGKRPITFYLEEANQLGEIKDLDKKVSAVRSRGISTTLIFQDINMLHNLYGIDMTRTVLNNCASWVLIGSNDMTTNEFMGKRAGTMTVVQRQERLDERTIGEALNYHPTKSVNYGDVKRETLTLGEMFRSEGVLVFLSSSYPLQLDIFDMTEHPMYSETESSAAVHHKSHANPKKAPSSALEDASANTPWRAEFSHTPTPEATRPPAASLPVIPSRSNPGEPATNTPQRAENFYTPIQNKTQELPSDRRPRVNIPAGSEKQPRAQVEMESIRDSVPIIDPKRDPVEFDARTHAYYNKKREALPEGKTPDPYFQGGRWVVIDNKKWTKDAPLVLQKPPRNPIYVEETQKWYYAETIKDPSPCPLKNQPPIPDETEKEPLTAQKQYQELLKPKRIPVPKSDPQEAYPLMKENTGKNRKEE